jgi:hypothetical protein
MAWISITKATLYDAKAAALIDACDTAVLGAGQTDRSTGIIQSVVDDLRRKVASCRRNQLDADTTTIPQGLRNLAVDLIIARLKVALELDLSEDERRTLAQHERDLNRVANGEDVVDQPDNPVIAPMEPTVPPPSFGVRCATSRWGSVEG